MGGTTLRPDLYPEVTVFQQTARLLVLSLMGLSSLPGCAEQGETAAPSAQGAPVQTLPQGVELVSSTIGTEGDALRGTGTLRFPWTHTSQEVTYEVTGTPAATPEVYEVKTTAPQTGATARLAYQIEQGAIHIEVPGHAVELTHNPDGSFSLAGRVYASLQDVVDALVADVDMAPLSAELLAAATVGLGAATRAASTRVPDGYCDPAWFCLDPDCPMCAHALQERYTCERWGEGSEGCAFYKAYEP